jgi:hypothetical protein
MELHAGMVRLFAVRTSVFCESLSFWIGIALTGLCGAEVDVLIENNLVFPILSPANLAADNRHYRRPDLPTAVGTWCFHSAKRTVIVARDVAGP